MNKKIDFETYISHMAEIRRLSTPSLEGIKSAENYSERLRNNFSRIGELAMENRAVLDEDIFPFLNSEELLLPEEVAEITSFSSGLIDAQNVENLDLPLAKLLSNKLVEDAKKKGNQSILIRQMDHDIESYYAMMNMAERIRPYPELYTYYRNQGLETGDFFRTLREKENFAAIEDETDRELVLTNARYASAFYENFCGDPEANRRNLEELEETLRIADDPFYRELMPDFDWDYYRYRTLQYYSLNTNLCNERNFGKEDLETIAKRTEEFWELWNSDPETYGEMDSESHVKMALYLNRYLTGRISAEEYKEELLQIYWNRNKQLYDEAGITENVQLPTEIICLLGTQRLSQENMAYYVMLYRDILDYVFRMPNSGTFSFMLEYLCHFMERFIEIPGGISFEDMMVNLLAALHPPTYVHTQMVAHIAECLCGHLIRLHPDLFIGICGCKTEEEVAEKASQIRAFAFHAALCHDVGKVYVMDTIFVYGRNLLDMEFDIIKTHPEIGSQLLRRYPTTEQYADVARGHHRWFDNSRGYPDAFDTSESPVKTIIDLTMCADCIDAATDTIGRSYKKGKMLSDVSGELEAEAGTHYADWIVSVLKDPEALEDLNWVLTSGREILYRETYLLLKNVHDQVKGE